MAPLWGSFDPSPNALNALPLSPANCGGNILLATHTDAAFLAQIGFPDSDPRVRNIPLRQVPVIADPDGLRRTLPPLGVLPPNPFPPTKSSPNDPVTSHAWSSTVSTPCGQSGKPHRRALLGLV
jgi:hypothetical protein